MKLILLGLKEKATGAYFVYDVKGEGKHTPIALNETKTVAVLSPFPFSNFSSLDTFNEKRFEKCYLEVDGDLAESEFTSMKSSGIVYFRFANRSVTLLNEFQDIFQYSYDMLKRFGKNLGTYELTTWVMHNETKSEAEYNAMKEILWQAVKKKENKEYPLDISIDVHTLRYMDVFRELSEKGYRITFGRYGTNDRDVFRNHNLTFSDETFFYLLQHVSLYDYSFFVHPKFTPAFYETYIKGQAAEADLFYHIEETDLALLQAKGFDIDELYTHFFYKTSQKLCEHYPEYEGDFLRIFSDPDLAPYTKYVSPMDYYCCEDCDGYDIHERYSEEELAGEEILVDERLDYAQQLIGRWADYLSPKCYPLFDRIPDDVLEQFTHQAFFKELLASRKKN